MCTERTDWSNMKSKVIILGAIFSVIVGITFSIGIFANPDFQLNEFCINLSSEFIGWVLAVTLFQYYYDTRIALRKSADNKESNSSASFADEILKLKKLLDDEVITKEEFDTLKKKLLA